MADEVAVKFTGSIEGIQTSVTQIRELLQGLEAPIRGIRAGLGELAEAFIAAFAVEKITEFSRRMGELGEHTERAAAILGVSTEDVGRLGLIAQSSGIAVEGLQSAFGQMSLRLVEESDQTKRALAALGLSFADLQGKGTVERLEILADAFEHLKDGPNKTAIAMALLGRAGAEMIPFLNKGRDGISEIADTADALGVALDTKATKALAETNQQFTLLSAAIKGAEVQAFLPFNGVLDSLLRVLRDMVQSFTTAIKEGGALATVISGLAVVCQGLVTVFIAIKTGVMELWAIFAYGWEVQIKGATTLGAVLKAVFVAMAEGTGSFFSGLWETAKSTVLGVGQIFLDLGAVIKGAFTGNFSEAFDKLKRDAAGIALTIADNFGNIGSKFDFSPAKTEFENFATFMKTRSTQLGVDLKALNEQALWQLFRTWQSGHERIEDEKKKHDRRMAAPANADLVSAAMKAIEGEIKALQEGLKLKIQVWDAGVKQYRIFEQTRYGLAEAATQQEYEAELALLRKELEIDGLKLAQKQAINNKIKDLEARHTREMVKLDDDAVQASAASWEKGLSSISSAFNSQLRGLLAGTTSFRQAFRSMIGDLVISFIQACEQMAVKWAAMQLAETTASVTGASTRAAAETAGQSASWAATIANALRSIASSVGVTIAGVTANQAPLTGPVAVAEGIAAGGLVQAAALGAMNFAEAGWWNVPAMSATLLHPGEMVVPRPFADDLRANGGAGGGTTHVWNITATDARSFVQQLRDNSSELARTVAKTFDLNPSLRASY